VPTKAKQAKSREPKKYIRHRVEVVLPNGTDKPTVVFRGDALHKKRSDALREGIDAALEAGIIVVREVPTKRRIAIVYEAVE
jgi:hypothetical protein